MQIRIAGYGKWRGSDKSDKGLLCFCCCFPSLGDWCRKLAPLLDQSDLRLYPMATCPCTFSRASGSSLEFTLSFNGFRDIFLCSDWRLLWLWLYVQINQNRIKLLSATGWGHGAIFSSKGKTTACDIELNVSKIRENPSYKDFCLCVCFSIFLWHFLFFKYEWTNLSGRCMLIASCDDHTQLSSGTFGICAKTKVNCKSNAITLFDCSW